MRMLIRNYIICRNISCLVFPAIEIITFHNFCCYNARPIIIGLIKNFFLTTFNFCFVVIHKHLFLSLINYIQFMSPCGSNQSQEDMRVLINNDKNFFKSSSHTRINREINRSQKAMKRLLLSCF